MNREDGKKAFTQAQKEVKEKAVEQLKEFIKRTLEARERQIKLREEANRKIKILDKDILDLKEGRIDRIEERQAADPKARETSVAIVKKDILKALDALEVHHYHHYDRWYYPFRFTWVAPIVDPVCTPIFGSTPGSGGFGATSNGGFSADSFTLNNSIAKDHTAGAYTLNINGSSTEISYIS